MWEQRPERSFLALTFCSETEKMMDDKEKAKTMAEVLYAQALLIAGMPIDNPSEYAEQVCSLF